MINLYTPFQRRKIELSGDLTVFEENNIRAVAVKISYDFFGEAKSKHITLFPKDNISEKFFEITLPKNIDDVNYTITWYVKNDAPKQNAIGANQKYQYGGDGTISLNISLIDTWIPLGDFDIDSTNTKISFHEGDKSVTKQLKFVEYRDPMPMQYKDENNVSQTIDLTCVKVGKYNIQENNTSLDRFYHMCKES